MKKKLPDVLGMTWREELDLSYAESLQNAFHLGDFEGAWEGATDRLSNSNHDLHNCLKRIENEVGKATDLIDRSPTPQHCLDCLLCKPSLSRQIREWKSNFEKLFTKVQTNISVF